MVVDSLFWARWYPVGVYRYNTDSSNLRMHAMGAMPSRDMASVHHWFLSFPHQPRGTEREQLFAFLDECKMNGVAPNVTLENADNEDYLLEHMFAHYAFSIVRCNSVSEAQFVLQMCAKGEGSIQSLEIDNAVADDVAAFGLPALFEQVAQVSALHGLARASNFGFGPHIAPNTEATDAITAINEERSSSYILKGGRRRRQTYRRRGRHRRTQKAQRKRKQAPRRRRGRRLYY